MKCQKLIDAARLARELSHDVKLEALVGHGGAALPVTKSWARRRRRVVGVDGPPVIVAAPLVPGSCLAAVLPNAAPLAVSTRMGEASEWLRGLLAGNQSSYRCQDTAVAHLIGHVTPSGSRSGVRVDLPRLGSVETREVRHKDPRLRGRSIRASRVSFARALRRSRGTQITATEACQAMLNARMLSSSRRFPGRGAETTESSPHKFLGNRAPETSTWRVEPQPASQTPSLEPHDLQVDLRRPVPVCRGRSNLGKPAPRPPRMCLACDGGFLGEEPRLLAARL